MMGEAPRWASVRTVGTSTRGGTVGSWPQVTDADCAAAKQAWDRARGPGRRGGARTAAVQVFDAFLARIQPPGTPVFDHMFDLVFAGVFPRDGAEVDRWAASQWRQTLEAARGLAKGDLVVGEGTRTLRGPGAPDTRSPYSDA